MALSINNRRTLIALAIVVAFVAIVVPTCRMVGCSMMGGRAWGDHVGIFGTCGGELVTTSAPNAVVPSGADALTLALVSVVILALALFSPRVRVQRIDIHSSDPPPPPADPWGQRFRI